MPNIIHSFRRWNIARRREAEAARWDAVADDLGRKRAVVESEIATAIRVRMTPAVIRSLETARAEYTKAERNARTIAERTRSGK